MIIPGVKVDNFLSFDGQENISVNLVRPDRYGDLEKIFEKSNEENFTILGSGMSLCMASGKNNNHCIDTKKFNRILCYKKEQCLIKVECGMLIGDLLKFAIDEKFWVSVLPGHPNITVGGCIGFNIHGKGKGYFIDIVDSLTIMHPIFGELVCSRKKNPEIFYLTLGGMGTTGLVIDVTIKLSPLKGNCLTRTKIPSLNIIDSLKIIQENKSQYAHVYSWNDLSRKTSHNFGRGFVYLEKFTNDESVKDSRLFKYLNSSNRSKSFLKVLSPILIPNMNMTYWTFEYIKKNKKNFGLFSGAFPISGKEVYYYIFGKTGYREYQVIIPVEVWDDFARDLLEISNSTSPTYTLGSLKVFESESRYLNFCKSGVVLSINVYANKKSINFFEELDRLTIKYKGLPNIAKDSRLSKKTIVSTYKDGYHAFVNDINTLFSGRHLKSELTSRLGID
jgi:decaprenylphospho-beta-D-ribofuranose 2-oxidase